MSPFWFGILYPKACILEAGQKGQECLTAINLNLQQARLLQQYLHTTQYETIPLLLGTCYHLLVSV